MAATGGSAASGWRIERRGEVVAPAAVVGRVVRDDFRESSLSLSSNPFAPADLTVVAKGDILRHEASPVSPMPPGLIDTFSKEEIFHLLDLLETGGTLEGNR